MNCTQCLPLLHLNLLGNGSGEMIRQVSSRSPWTLGLDHVGQRSLAIAVAVSPQPHSEDSQRKAGILRGILNHQGKSL